MVARKSCSPVLSGGVPRRRCGANWVSFPPMSNFAQAPAADGAMLAVAIPLHLLLSKMQPEQFSTSILAVMAARYIGFRLQRGNRVQVAPS